MSKKEFDRIKLIGRKLREIFDRDKVPFSDGCEDYLVRAVEEAQSKSLTPKTRCKCPSVKGHVYHVAGCSIAFFDALSSNCK